MGKKEGPFTTSINEDQVELIYTCADKPVLSAPVSNARVFKILSELLSLRSLDYSERNSLLDELGALITGDHKMLEKIDRIRAIKLRPMSEMPTGKIVKIQFPPRKEGIKPTIVFGKCIGNNLIEVPSEIRWNLWNHGVFGFDNFEGFYDLNEDESKILGRAYCV